VPEPRTAKLRMHLDLRAPAQVARLEALGATVFARYGELVVMQDPEGHEFCVED
jgi:Glyoxalase-like domain